LLEFGDRVAISGGGGGGEELMARGIVVPGALDVLAVAEPLDAAPLIVSFDPAILIMSSMRRPKRVRLYGSDGARRSFLVKAGEDLRMDERISGLFTLMNSVFSRDARCDGNVRVRTYHVTPMAPDVGMIEVCRSTLCLRTFVCVCNNRARAHDFCSGLKILEH
jgi:DNA-dependent protein kinase catalytic subunit